MFWEWKYKRKDLYLHLCIFIKLFYKIHECIKLIKIYSLSILIIWLFIMTDYSISDPKNKFELIWSCILKVMIFTIFIEFSGIFPELKWIYFEFLSFKLIKKSQTGVYFVRVHMDASWHARPRGHACLPAWRGCDTWTHIYIYYIVLYNMYIGLPIIGRQIINYVNCATF